MNKTILTGKPASLGAVVVFASVRHAGGAGVRSGEVNISGQLDQSDVMLDGVGFVEFRVDDDLGNGDVCQERMEIEGENSLSPCILTTLSSFGMKTCT